LEGWDGVDGVPWLALEISPSLKNPKQILVMTFTVRTEPQETKKKELLGKLEKDMYFSSRQVS